MMAGYMLTIMNPVFIMCESVEQSLLSGNK